jgi:tRNA(Ile)-lysidine synthase
MIRVQGKLPNNLFVACSGGVDSMAVLNFLVAGRRRPTVAYFNHGTEHSSKTEGFVSDYCRAAGLELVVGRADREKARGESREEYWRNIRYNFLHSLPGAVITAHNLNDCIETWIFTALNGEPRLIPYKNQNVIRPFRMTPKSDLIAWCKSRGVPWAEDASNSDVSYARNRIRHKIVPEATMINPGLEKVMRKKLMLDTSQLDESFA